MRVLAGYVILFLAKLFNINGLHVCRFEPSCSVYARQALKSQRPHNALWLILVRLWRCRPFGRSGYDPVPQKARALF